jgi:hypothetical protein
MKPRLALPFLLSFYVCSASAADWWFVAWEHQGEGDAIAYVDKSRLERINRGSRLNAWTAIVFREDRNGEFGKFRSERSKLIVDCETLQSGAKRRTLYSAYGASVHDSQQSEPVMETPLPDSLALAIVKFVCSDGKQSSTSLPVYDPNKDAEQRFWLRSRQNGP